jgi:hypothetical protein
MAIIIYTFVLHVTSDVIFSINAISIGMLLTIEYAGIHVLDLYITNPIGTLYNEQVPRQQVDWQLLVNTLPILGIRWVNNHFAVQIPYNATSDLTGSENAHIDGFISQESLKLQ